MTCKLAPILALVAPTFLKDIYGFVMLDYNTKALKDLNFGNTLKIAYLGSFIDLTLSLSILYSPPF